MIVQCSIAESNQLGATESNQLALVGGQPLPVYTFQFKLITIYCSHGGQSGGGSINLQRARDWLEANADSVFPTMSWGDYLRGNSNDSDPWPPTLAAGVPDVMSAGLLGKQTQFLIQVDPDTGGAVFNPNSTQAGSGWFDVHNDLSGGFVKYAWMMRIKISFSVYIQNSKLTSPSALPYPITFASGSGIIDRQSPPIGETIEYTIPMPAYGVPGGLGLQTFGQENDFYFAD